MRIEDDPDGSLKNSTPRPQKQSGPVAARVFSTGSLAIDLALGVGGLPGGIIAEVEGPAASGKTTLGLHLLAQAQRAGLHTAFIDMDHSLDPVHAAWCGVDLDGLLLAEPETGEQALDTIEILLSSGAVSVIVFDSVTTLLPRQEQQAGLGAIHTGVYERLIANSLHQLARLCARYQGIVLFTSQMRRRAPEQAERMRIPSPYLALKLHAAVRMELGQPFSIVENGISTGQVCRARIVKNKFGRSSGPIKLLIMYNQGICNVGEILDQACKLKLILSGDRGFAYRGHQMGLGREQAEAFLKRNPALAAELEERIRRQVIDRPCY